MPLKLYAPKEGPRIQKILIAAKYAGVDIEFPAFEFGKDNKTEQFMLKNPVGKIPVLETEQGFLFESNAIAKYVAKLDPKKSLFGSTELQAAQVDQWLDFTATEIDPPAYVWLLPIFGYGTYDAASNQEAVNKLKSALKALNFYLERHTYLVGERISLADIVVAASLLPLYARVFEPRFRTPFANVNRWFETVSQQDNFRSVLKLEPMAWCTVAQKPKHAKVAKKEVKEEEEEGTEEATKETSEEPVKKEEEKKEAPKEAKKKDKKKEDDEEEEEEEGEKEEKKPNPLDALPKSTFPLDQFKREYTNNPVAHSLKYFLDTFDPAGYSLWYCNYKYNEECTMAFKTANLIGGYFQRLERWHKYAFGSMLIVGEDKKHEIVGFWIFRGTEFPEGLNDVPDTELYEWTKIEWSDIAAHTDKIKSFFAWEKIDGKEVLDGKTFK